MAIKHSIPPWALEAKPGHHPHLPYVGRLVPSLETLAAYNPDDDEEGDCVVLEAPSPLMNHVPGQGAAPLSSSSSSWSSSIISEPAEKRLASQFEAQTKKMRRSDGSSNADAGAKEKRIDAHALSTGKIIITPLENDIS